MSEHDWDAVIASDYGKGFLSPDILENVAFLCRQKKVPLFMDTKAVLGSWSAGVFCVKINAKEFAHQKASGVKWPHEMCENLIVTQGARGMMLFAPDGSEAYRTTPEEAHVADSVGCGDTVLAALVVRYLTNGGNLKTAMDYAARAATVAVSKPGVVAVGWEEVE